MKTIRVSQGRIALIDDDDFDRVSQYKWSAVMPFNPGKTGKTYYAHRSIKINGKWTHISLHRFIMNAEKGVQVDHADGNGLDNQKSNLRLCTHVQNSMNKKGWSKHGLKGLGFIKDCIPSRQWRASIRVNKKLIHIGLYASKIDAAIAYNIAAIKHFGEFAKLNPIPFTYDCH